MNQKRISDATMRVRDVLYDGLLLRSGMVLDEPLARERAANLSTAVLEVLAQMVEERKASDEPPPVRFAGQGARHLEDLPEDETIEAHAERVIR